jgi:hypothetical protein
MTSLNLFMQGQTLDYTTPTPTPHLDTPRQSPNTSRKHHPQTLRTNPNNTTTYIGSIDVLTDCPEEHPDCPRDHLEPDATLGAPTNCYPELFAVPPPRIVRRNNVTPAKKKPPLREYTRGSTPDS